MAQGHLDSLLTLTDEPQSGPSTELCVCVCVCAHADMCVWGGSGEDSGGSSWLFSSSRTQWLGCHHDAHLQTMSDEVAT